MTWFCASSSSWSWSSSSHTHTQDLLFYQWKRKQTSPFSRSCPSKKKHNCELYASSSWKSKWFHHSPISIPTTQSFLWIYFRMRLLNGWTRWTDPTLLMLYYYYYLTLPYLSLTNLVTRWDTDGHGKKLKFITYHPKCTYLIYNQKTACAAVYYVQFTVNNKNTTTTHSP